MTNKTVRGILFDLGETLIDFGKINIGQMFHAGALLGYEYLKQLDQPVPTFRTYVFKQFLAVRWNCLKSFFAKRDFCASVVIEEQARKMGQTLTDEQVMHIASLWYAPLRDASTVEPHLAEMLATMAASGMKLGVVSNTFIPGEVLDAHLEQERMLESLDVRVYSSQTGYRKPDKRIFDKALSEMGLPPHEVMFIGDKLKPDIYGSRQAGLIPVLKDPTGRWDNARIKPDHSIRKMADLPEVLKKYGVQAAT